MTHFSRSPGDYLDPESDDWTPPRLTPESKLPNNTKTFGPLFLWQGRISNRQAVVSVAVTREIHPPWRHGVGISIRWDRPGESYGYAVGVWKKGKPPRILSAPPVAKNLRLVVKRADRLDNLSGDFVTHPGG